MKGIVGPIIAIVMAAGMMSVRAALPVDETFQGYGVGYLFSSPTNNWRSGAAVWVTNGNNRFSDTSASNSVVLADSSALTNAVDSNAVTAVWTDFYIKPFTGEYPDVPPTNSSSFVQYYDTNGYVVVALPNGWRTCSNDVWGAPVAPVLNDWIHVSLYQDFGSSNLALMVNDQLVLQDVRFAGAVPSYNRFIIQNPESNACLDDVWIQTTYNPVLTANRNGDAEGMSDAQELQLYGYAARTQYVGTSGGYPLYATLQSALDAYRPRDILCVTAGSFSEALVITQSVIFTGVAFTNTGSLSVASGASVTFNQSVKLSTLNLTGTVNLVSGSLECDTANVSATGLLNVSDGVVFRNLAALSLTAGGRLDFLGATSRFVSTPDSLDMTGQFSITNNLGDAVVVGIPFADDFQKYVIGTSVNALKFLGWGVSDVAAVVTYNASLADDTAGRTTSRTVCLPEGAMISNRLSSAAGQKIWTDYYTTPSFGEAPLNPATNTASFLGYIDTNGWLVVATSAGWVTCSSDYTNGPAPVLNSNSFCRISFCQDFAQHTFAVFLNGTLLREQLTFPSASVNQYSSFSVNTGDGATYLDDVSIAAAVPAGLPYQAREIDTYGTVFLSGSTYLMR